MEDRQLRFGAFVLDTKRKLLLKQGAPVALGQRGLALLEALASAHGRVVSKADLMDIAWPALQVEESNLSVQIATLRKCLGKMPDGRDWIVAIPRVGYQLIDIGADAVPEVPPDAQTVHSMPQRISVAVLPFQNLSGDPEQEYFSYGITEDIITDLSKVSGLSVIAHSSVFFLKNRSEDIRATGHRLGVSYLLEGGVRRVEDRVRVTTQLINTADGTHLWAERYDRNLLDVLGVQGEIAKAIADQLTVRLLPQERRAIDSMPTQNIGAYDLYLQGRYCYHLHTASHAHKARRLFQKAIELDPTYALAFAGLADAGSFLYVVGDPDVTISEILGASERAIQLAPKLGAAHAAQGLALVRAGRSQAAIRAFEHALSLDPNLFEAHYHFSEARIELRQWELAAASYLRALELSPDDYRCLLMLGFVYWAQGNRTKAEEADRAGIKSAERALAAHPNVPLAAILGASALAQQGERARSIEWIERALAAEPIDAHIQYNAACTYSLLGEAELALDLLEKWAARAHFTTKKWIESDTDFDSIRHHPRFQALLTSIDE